MAHNISINKNTGQAEVFTAGKPAWHKLGANVDKTVTWEKAMELAGLNWQVQKRQLQEGGRNVPAWGTFRQDTNQFLGSVGSDWEPIQNKEAFDFVDTILQAKNGAHYETAGALGTGERIWCLARVPEDIRVGDDVSQSYFLFTNPHKIGSAVAKLTSTRVVCSNTLSIALKDGSNGIIKIRHTPNKDEQMKVAEGFMMDSIKHIKDLSGLMNALAKHKLTMPELQDVLKTTFTKLEESSVQQNKARRVLELYESNDNNKFPSQRGTAYNLLNAFTNYIDHETSVRPAMDETEDQARARNAMFGIGEMLKFRLLNMITEKTAVSVNTDLLTLTK